jgi:flagellar biosynthesis protein FliQ
MDSAFFVDQVQRAIWIIALACIPIILPALLAGLVTGIVQAATSVNEAALGFVVKLVVVGIALALTGSAIMALLTDFTIEMFSHIQDVVR